MEKVGGQMAKRRTLIYGFWDRVEEALNDKGMSKCELARRIGYDRKTIYRHESITNSLAIAKICVQLNVSADWLLGITTQKKPLNTSVR